VRHSGRTSCSPLAGIVLMQSYPLFRVNDDRTTLAFANGQVHPQSSGRPMRLRGAHRAVRDRFVEDIRLAARVKSLGLPIRVAIARGIGSTRMYASLDQLVRGWSRILYDCPGTKPLASSWPPARPIDLQPDRSRRIRGGPLPARFEDKAVRSRSGCLGLSVVHHVFSYMVLDQVYRMSVPRTRYVAWFPVAKPHHGRDPRSRHPDVPDWACDLARHGLWTERRRGSTCFQAGVAKLSRPDTVSSRRVGFSLPALLMSICGI